MVKPPAGPHQLPPPDAASLHEAALTYLARYAATEAGLLRVLQRRIDRWAAQTRASDADGDATAGQAAADRDATAGQAAAASVAAREVVARLAAAGAISDAAYAESKVRSLVRAGKSRQAIGAQLAAKGIGPDTRRAMLPTDPGTELAAALVLARRRRIGPFRTGETAGGGLSDGDTRRRELAILARAGFPSEIARRALALDPREAETLVNQLRR